MYFSSVALSVSEGLLPYMVSAQMTWPPLLSAPTGAGAKSHQARHASMRSGRGVGVERSRVATPA